MTARSSLLAASVVGLILSACGGEPPLEARSPSSEQTARRSAPSPLQTSAEVGGLDPEATKRAFESASSKLSACYMQGTERQPYLAGDVEFYVRVGGDGRAVYVYIADSTLGDREVESCMRDALEATRFPLPQGGAQGIATRSMHFDPGGDERPPVEWSPADLGPALASASKSTGDCAATAGAGPMKATLYIGTDGKPESVGVSVSDAAGERAVGCVVDALRSTKFASPGSYPAKASVELP